MPEDIALVLQRRWDQGDLVLRSEQVFPLTIPLRNPDPPELGRRLPEVQVWIDALRRGSRDGLGYGYDVVSSVVTTRQLGTNPMPIEVTIPTLEDGLALIGRQSDHALWRDLFALTERRCPALRPWLDEQPLTLLTYADVWERVLDVVTWFLAHPRPACYVRQIDIPGIDTKFIERQTPLLRRLLDVVLPPEAIDLDSDDFTTHFCLRRKPTLMQIRILDPRLAVGGLTHFSAPKDQLAALVLPVQRVIITENEVNGLALPAMEGAATIFGLGYSIDDLVHIPWLTQATLHYWGDIDTHGFAILDRLRAYLPRATSMLMDEQTLLSHRDHWVEEPEPAFGALKRLTDDEQRVYTGLLRHRWGERVRLEQERIGFRHVQSGLANAMRG
jgi:hypothetical protein